MALLRHTVWNDENLTASIFVCNPVV